MKLSEYLKISQSRQLMPDLDMNFSVEENLLLENFCDSNVSKSHKQSVFSIILDVIADNKKEDMLSDKLLESLISQEISLSDLSHMNLQDKYLIKIFKKNNSYYECMLTVYKRNINSNTSYNDFANIVRNNLCVYSACYNIILFSNISSLSLLQLQKIMFLCQISATPMRQYAFFRKYIEYYKERYDSCLSKIPINEINVFSNQDFLKLYEIKNTI